MVSGVNLVICGHTIIRQPRTLGNHLFIDLGAYKQSGAMCMVELCNPAVVHVEASQQADGLEHAA